MLRNYCYSNKSIANRAIRRLLSTHGVRPTTLVFPNISTRPTVVTKRYNSNFHNGSNEEIPNKLPGLFLAGASVGLAIFYVFGESLGIKREKKEEEPEQVEPEQAEPEQAEPEVATSEATTSEVKPENTTPEATPENTTPEATPENTTSEVKPENTTPENTTSEVKPENTTPEATPENTTPENTTPEVTPENTTSDATTPVEKGIEVVEADVFVDEKTEEPIAVEIEEATLEPANQEDKSDNTDVTTESNEQPTADDQDSIVIVQEIPIKVTEGLKQDLANDDVSFSTSNDKPFGSNVLSKVEENIVQEEPVIIATATTNNGFSENESEQSEEPVVIVEEEIVQDIDPVKVAAAAGAAAGAAAAATSNGDSVTTGSSATPVKTPEGEKRETAYNPETGEINWDCPCLGGMAHGPCGEQFKEAFSCFVYSEAEPKGIDCVEKFQNMQNCFREHPEHYVEQLKDDDEAMQKAEQDEAMQKAEQEEDEAIVASSE
ncbi:Mia40p SCDLUD_004309 [Saccharomycodes ludwigii]|uniref:Mia40p n=1 Tax=Saccharomycodes ludwigii TaxID=36035 RepID=UPI001E856B73|nr:hypothetical protein SCDLUD_004309 [Saccharomycodes ludwigii]KAH3899992.1 hypothetical protein SCDLUD_004309 [Saccharomycodes ludwigii]